MDRSGVSARIGEGELVSVEHLHLRPPLSLWVSLAQIYKGTPHPSKDTLPHQLENL